MWLLHLFDDSSNYCNQQWPSKSLCCSIFKTHYCFFPASNRVKPSFLRNTRQVTSLENTVLIPKCDTAVLIKPDGSWEGIFLKSVPCLALVKGTGLNWLLQLYNHGVGDPRTLNEEPMVCQICPVPSGLLMLYSDRSRSPSSDVSR